MAAACALAIISGRIILNFGFQESLRTFLKPILTGGVWNELPQSKPDDFASFLGEGASGAPANFASAKRLTREYPFRLAAARQSTFPKGTAFGGGDKVSGIAIRRPLGGAGTAKPCLRRSSPIQPKTGRCGMQQPGKSMRASQKPYAVRGKGSTSRMFWMPVRYMIIRSKPRP